MPLPSPILDDRSYQQLREELIRRIPVYTPEWTDHNESDPGIALLELFAFLGENLLYRFNQIPEATQLAFLRLLRVPLRPASPATGLVAFSTAKTSGPLVAPGTEVRAGKVPFETQVEVRVWPLALRGVVKRRAEAPADPELAAHTQAALHALGGLPAGASPIHYVVESLPDEPEAPGAAAPDLTAAVDGSLWLAALSPGGDIRAALAGGLLNIGVAPREEVASAADVGPCPGPGYEPEAADLIWQISTGALAGGAGPPRPRYRALTPAGDTTRGLREPGVVRLELPSDPLAFGDFELPDPFLAGAGDFPPELEDEDEASQVLFWLRVSRRDGGALPGLRWVGANASAVQQRRTAGGELLGTGDGQPRQVARLVHRPVLEGSLVVEVEEADGWQPWREVSGFHASGADDRHFVLDRQAGQVEFGDGLRGRAPQIGERIRATTYRVGGGVRGNVPAGGITKVEVDGVEVTSPLPTRGGQDDEAVAEALDRIPGELRRRDRAVAAGDFRELARQTPGAAVGRAEVLPLYHPHAPEGVEVPGAVSVVVWPREDAARPNAPMPDRGMLRAVCRWLDARRLVTTELYVIPPTYREIAVSVGVAIEPGAAVEAVRQWVELALRQLLSPLPPFGPSGDGWPLGRRVHAPELEAAALQVEGVAYLEGLTLAQWDAATESWAETTTVTLSPVEVPSLTSITVVRGAPEPAGAPLGAPDPEGTPVVIPTLRQEC